MEKQEDQIPLEHTLLFTQDIRKALVKKIVGESGSTLPPDNLTAALLPKLLDGMDKQTLTRMRIKSEEKRDSEGAKAIVAAFLSSVNANDLTKKNTQAVQQADLIMPDDIAEANDKVTDERQMAQGTQNDTVEAFNERMGIEN